jgi:hypothetical protein
VQDLLRRAEAGELPDGTPPLLPDGTYTLRVTKAEAGSDHIYVHMLAHTGDLTRIRLTFTERAGHVTTAQVLGFGISAAEAPKSLDELAQTLIGREIEAELGHYVGDSRTFQVMKPGTVRLVAS